SRARATRHVAQSGGPAGGFGPGGGGLSLDANATPEKSMQGAPAAAGAPQPDADYSQTNVQEAGVDEPDTVKTDGRHIFAIAGQTLYAAALDSGKPRIVGKLPLSGYGFQLLLAGDRLAVLSGDQAVVRP